MIEAPTLDSVRKHHEAMSGAGCCIVLAPPFSAVGKEEMIPRLAYLDERSGEYVHFYCAGYGGYWHVDNVPDMENVGVVNYDGGKKIPWAFSPRLFARFVADLEQSTRWRYSGDAEMILLDHQADFSDALVLKVAAMADDGCIRSSAELFEVIIRYYRESVVVPSARGFSDHQGLKVGTKWAVESLQRLFPTPIRGLWKKGRHYAARDLRK